MSTAATYQQPWIGRPIIDSVFILLPPFGCLLFIALFPSLFQNTDGLSEAWWVLLILLVDVAHVYSTLYRTYFDPVAMRKHRSLMLGIPLAAFIAGVVLYSSSSVLFWRLLAYIAVFHFIRQQYGFMRLYSRKEKHLPAYKLIDTIAIYTATIYPILYWHISSPRNFNWFVQNDFYFFELPWLLPVATALYIIIAAIYLVKEIYISYANKQINLPKNAVVVGTFLSWYFGIVYFNGDMAFTLLNVVSHGIPYMALIWLYGEKQYGKTAINQSSKLLQFIFRRKMILAFIGIIFLLAFIEEGLWDMAVWNEHRTIFAGFHLADFTLSKDVLNIVVPLLAVPQLTHYIIDGFIWRIKQDDVKWKRE